MTSPSVSLRNPSRALILTGILSTAIGSFTLGYPAVGEDSLWGYPFEPGPHVVVAIALVVAHLLKAYGFIGLSRLEGGGPAVRWSMLVASLGFVVLAACEGVSGTMFGTPLDTPAAINLNNGYGAGSMIEAIASMVGGTVILRKGLLAGHGRWSVLLSGAFMVFVVTPALFTGRGPLAYGALTVWSLFYLWIGVALGKTHARASLLGEAPKRRA